MQQALSIVHHPWIREWIMMRRKNAVYSIFMWLHILNGLTAQNRLLMNVTSTLKYSCYSHSVPTRWRIPISWREISRSSNVGVNRMRSVFYGCLLFSHSKMSMGIHTSTSIHHPLPNAINHKSFWMCKCMIWVIIIVNNGKIVSAQATCTASPHMDR